MKAKSVYLNEADLNELQKLVNQGYYPNVSEAIRHAIKDLIKYYKLRGGERVAEADVAKR